VRRKSPSYVVVEAIPAQKVRELWSKEWSACNVLVPRERCCLDEGSMHVEIIIEGQRDNVEATDRQPAAAHVSSMKSVGEESP